MAMARKQEKLSRAVIARAALECLDTVGFTAFSLRGVARALGVFPGALYWHMPGGRESLLAAAAGEAVRDILPAPEPHRTWQDWLRALLRNYRRAIQAHPNVAPILGSQLLSNMDIDLRVVDEVLATLCQAGFRDAALIDAYNTVIAAMAGFTTMELAPLPSDGLADWQRGIQERLSAVDPDRYPHLGRHLNAMRNRAFVTRWENGLSAPLDGAFNAFVETMIRGLETGVAQELTPGGAQRLARDPIQGSPPPGTTQRRPD